MNSSSSGHSGSALEALRQELDNLDDSILALLSQRFAVTEQVKALKHATTKLVQSPLRPAREAQIMRRLVAAAAAKGLDPAFVLRLWRCILAESSQRQLPVTIHIAKRLNATMGHRLRLRDHFGAMAVEEWKDEAQALMQVNAAPGDLCVVETESPWIGPMIEGRAGAARVIATLPVLQENMVPRLLIIGHGSAEPTGQDETLLITQGNLPRDFAPQPLWQIKVGSFRLSALAGFFSDHESPLVGLGRSNISLGLMLAGRYPSAIEV
jgi:chorismate mutase